MNVIPPSGQAESKQLGSIPEEDTAETPHIQSLSTDVSRAVENTIAKGQVSAVDLTKHKVLLSPKLSETVLQMQKEEPILQRTYNYKLPFPSDMKNVKQHVKVKSEKEMILWRGCNRDQLLGIAKKGSAGGLDFDLDTRPPTEQEAKDQVGERISIPEFTCDPTVAQGFATGTFIAAVKIPAKYLTKGSNTESGWVCLPSAPVKLLAWKEGGGSAFQRSESPQGTVKQTTLNDRMQFLKEKNEALNRLKGQGSLAGRNIQTLPPKSPTNS
jgi:hypothetical protein